MTSTKPTKEQFRKVLGRFATGITVVTVAREGGGVHGMTANSFTSVSLDPLLVLICVDYRARALEFLQVEERFGVSILNEDQQPFSEFFARPQQEGEAAQRLGVHFERTAQGTPLLSGCLASMECRKVAVHPAGDHAIFIGEVESLHAVEGRPLLFYGGRYRKLEVE